MPIYEYACQKCGLHLEVMQKISDDPLKKHEKCGGKLEKQWSQTSFQLKGSGWYVTDYAGKKSGETTETKTDTNAKADAGETPKVKDAGTSSEFDAKSETPKPDGKKDESKKDVSAKSETKSDTKPATSAAKQSKKK